MSNVTTIPSPYNFAPLPGKVLFVNKGSEDLNNYPSHDIPFKEGMSGSITIKVTAETPIMIGDSDDKKDDKAGGSKVRTFFKLPDGRHAIPGTSIKGAIRNVMEILTAGILQCNDRKYSIRDLYNEDYTSLMTTSQKPHRTTVQAGWLSYSEDEDEWYLTPCEFCRADQSKIETLFQGIRIGFREPPKKRIEKFATFAGYPCPTVFISQPEEIFVTPETKYISFKAPNEIRRERSASCLIQGALVLTGQPGNRGSGKTFKKRDFIFYNERSPVKIGKEQMNEFQILHSEEQPKQDNKTSNKVGEPNETWGFWKERINENHRAPVFYLAYTEESPEQGEVSPAIDTPNAKLYAMGLSMMFRLPMKMSIHDARRNSDSSAYLTLESSGLKDRPHDFAETLLGFVDNTECLRGRVSFEPLPTKGNAKSIPNVRAILGAPKASYYPNYLEQKPDQYGKINEFCTFQSDDAVLKGWKRYPVRTDINPTGLPNQPNEKIVTTFQPLDKGAVFEGEIFYHNLRKQELGALLWALTWGGHGKFKHSMGMARPLGYGTCRIEVLTVADAFGKGRKDWESLMNEFENWIKKAVGNPDYFQTPSIQQLLAMANPEAALDWKGNFAYPVLNENRNDFQLFKSKKDKRILAKYGRDPKYWRMTQPVILQKTLTESFPVGSEVIVEAYSHNKKKGIWRFRIVGTDGEDATGTIIPEERGKLPKEINMGLKLHAIVDGTGKGAFKFKLKD